MNTCQSLEVRVLGLFFESNWGAGGYLMVKGSPRSGVRLVWDLNRITVL